MRQGDSQSGNLNLDNLDDFNFFLNSISFHNSWFLVVRKSLEVSDKLKVIMIVTVLRPGVFLFCKLILQTIFFAKIIFQDFTQNKFSSSQVVFDHSKLQSILSVLKWYFLLSYHEFPPQKCRYRNLSTSNTFKALIFRSKNFPSQPKLSKCMVIYVCSQFLLTAPGNIV